MRWRWLIWICLIVVPESMAWAQSGAPSRIRYEDRLVDAMGQPVTQPTEIRIQLIQGGTASEMPTTGRVVFEERARVTPNEYGFFEYIIGTNARGPIGRQGFDAEDLNTTLPVFVEVAMVEGADTGSGTFQVLLPRQRLLSAGYALQAQHAADAAVDDRFVNVEGDNMTGPLRIDSSLRVGSGGPPLGEGDVFIADKLQVGATSFQVIGSQGGIVRLNLPGTPADDAALGVGIQGVGSTPAAMPPSPVAVFGAASSGDAVRGETMSGAGVRGVAPGGIGVIGTTDNGTGVRGTSDGGIGVAGSSDSNFGVFGSCNGGSTSALAGVAGTSSSHAGVAGFSGTGVGILARSESGNIMEGYDGNSRNFMVTNAGELGIGSPAPLPSAKVHAMASGGFDAIRGESSGGYGVIGESASGIGVRGESGSNVGVVAESASSHIFEGYGLGTLRFRIENDGDTFVNGMMVLTSDARLKTHIQPITGVLEKLERIHGISYERTDLNRSPARREIGVIAQEVEAVFPELVSTWGENGYKSVAYGQLTAVLIEAVKVLRTEKEELRAELQSLKLRVDALMETIRK